MTLIQTTLPHDYLDYVNYVNYGTSTRRSSSTTYVYSPQQFHYIRLLAAAVPLHTSTRRSSSTTYVYSPQHLLVELIIGQPGVFRPPATLKAKRDRVAPQVKTCGSTAWFFRLRRRPHPHPHPHPHRPPDELQPGYEYTCYPPAAAAFVPPPCRWDGVSLLVTTSRSSSSLARAARSAQPVQRPGGLYVAATALRRPTRPLSDSYPGALAILLAVR